MKYFNNKNFVLSSPCSLTELRLIDEYRDMYISQDLTPEQKTAGKLVRDELKRRINNGEVNLRIRRGKIIPIQRDN